MLIRLLALAAAAALAYLLLTHSPAVPAVLAYAGQGV